MSVLLAHQGGWDELALFVAPVIIALVLVRWAERRARRKRAAEAEDRAAVPDDRRVEPDGRP